MLDAVKLGRNIMKHFLQLMFCLTVSILFMTSIAYADSFNNKEDIDNFIKEIIPNLINNNDKKVFNELKPYWPIPEVEIDSLVNQLDLQEPMIAKRFGKSLSMEFIKSESIGNSLYKITYLRKYEAHAMRWVFLFYKPSDIWYVNSVSTDDKLLELYE